MRRQPFPVWIVLVLLAIAGVDGLRQAITEARDRDPGSPALAAWHLVTGLGAVAAFSGVWRRTAWSRAAIALWGGATAAMVLSLERLGFADRSDRTGLWQGAAMILALTVVMQWVVGRAALRAGGPAVSDDSPS